MGPFTSYWSCAPLLINDLRGPAHLRGIGWLSVCLGVSGVAARAHHLNEISQSQTRALRLEERQTVRRE